MTRRERLEAKIEKRETWATSASAKSDAAFEGVRRIADNIPLGQPILVGHHSERHARRDQARIESGMTKGCELQKKAAGHRSKAAGLQNQLDNSIFSDDDNAIAALEARIAEREAKSEQMKSINQAWRKMLKTGARSALHDLGISDTFIDKTQADMAAHPYLGDVPYPGYSMTNLRANIRRDYERIEEIKRRTQRVQAAENAGGVVVSGTGEYVSVTFAEKPDRSIINALKAAGFWWRGGSWQGRRDALPEEVKE
jgi:hypothetical protein